MSAYYNENDKKTAAWLRALIKAKVIAGGEVDERSIVYVHPDDLRGFTQCHFFAGIGGWSYALRLAGWPDTREVWTGSCPCQPYSQAGSKKGDRDARHLWPLLRELIRERAPSVVFGEQVASPAGRQWLSRVRADLEAMEHGVGAADLCAASVKAPHPRHRLFWMAYANSDRRDKERASQPTSRHDGIVRDSRAVIGVGDADSSGLSEQRGTVAVSSQQFTAERRGNACRGMGDATRRRRGKRGDETLSRGSGHIERASWSRFDILQFRDGKARRVEAGTFPLADGIPGRVGLLRGYGNAIVPQVAATFIEACNEIIIA